MARVSVGNTPPGLRQGVTLEGTGVNELPPAAQQTQDIPATTAGPSIGDNKEFKAATYEQVQSVVMPGGQVVQVTVTRTDR